MFLRKSYFGLVKNLKGFRGAVAFSVPKIRSKEEIAGLPKLFRKPEAILVKYWWSEPRWIFFLEKINYGVL